MTIPSCSYGHDTEDNGTITDGCSDGTCTLEYSASSNTDLSLTISGTNFIVDATAVTFTSSLTQTETRTISVSITGNTRADTYTYDVNIEVTPCTINIGTITSQLVYINTSKTWNFSDYSTGNCGGTSIFELDGGNLSYL